MTLFSLPKPVLLFTYPTEIEGVVDGDTLDLKVDLGFHIYLRQRIRLYGIDTKEIFGPKREPAGQKSKIFSTAWVEKGHADGKGFILSVRKYDDREKYGRILGVLFRGGDDVSLNDALINAGLAKPSPASWGLGEEIEV